MHTGWAECTAGAASKAAAEHTPLPLAAALVASLGSMAGPLALESHMELLAPLAAALWREQV